MSSFSYEWVDEGGVRILYSRPTGQIREPNWIEHFDARLGEYLCEHGCFIIDFYGIDYDLGFAGIKNNMELLQKYYFKSARYALLSNDPQDYLIAKLFNEIAKIEKFDAVVKVFSDNNKAKYWLMDTYISHHYQENYGSGQIWC